jgi:hypothetical protein
LTYIVNRKISALEIFAFLNIRFSQAGALGFSTPHSVTIGDSREGSMTKFMQMVDPSVYAELEAIAGERGISVQELIRAIIIPEWLRCPK